MEKHYICLGTCKGLSGSPGSCQAEDCPNHQQSLTACDCVDGEHEGQQQVQKEYTTEQHETETE